MSLSTPQGLIINIFLKKEKDLYVFSKHPNPDNLNIWDLYCIFNKISHTVSCRLWKELFMMDVRGMDALLMSHHTFCSFWVEIFLGVDSSHRLIWTDFMFWNILSKTCLYQLDTIFIGEYCNWTPYTGLVDSYCTFMALSLFAKLLMMERDSWKRELPVSATSEISWLTAMMIWMEQGAKGE